MTQIEFWSIEIEKSVRGKELSRPDTYFHARETLLDKIIWLLVRSQSNSPSEDYIRKAVGLNALDLAKKAILNAFKDQYESQEFYKARAILHLNSEIFHSYKIQLLPNLIAELSDEIQAKCEVELEIEKLRKDLSNLKSLPKGKREFAAGNFLAKINSIKSGSNNQRFKLKRLKTRALFLVGKAKEALLNQEELVRQLEDLRIVQGYRIQEISLLSQLYGDIGNSEKATYWALQLGSIVPSTEQDYILKKKLFIRNGMIIANKFWRSNLSSLALESLSENFGMFNRNTEGLFLYTGALIAHGNRDWEQALHLVSKVISIPKRDRPQLTWQPYLLKTVVLHDKGDDFDPSYRAAVRQLKKQGNSFPWLVLKLLKWVNNTPHPISQSQFEDWSEDINSVLSDRNEQGCSNYFDLPLWLSSVLEKKSMAQIALSNQKADNAISLNSLSFL